MGEHEPKMIIAEIERIRVETKSGKIQWKLVEGKYCTYEVANNDSCLLTLQCCSQEPILMLNDTVIKVPRYLVEYLCETIVEQVQSSKEQVIVKLLQTIKPKEARA